MTPKLGFGGLNITQNYLNEPKITQIGGFGGGSSDLAGFGVKNEPKLHKRTPKLPQTGLSRGRYDLARFGVKNDPK